MSTGQQNPPYPSQPGIPPYPNQGGYGPPPPGFQPGYAPPAQSAGYPSQPGYPPAGYPAQPATGYPAQPATGYPSQPGYPPPQPGYPDSGIPPPYSQYNNPQYPTYNMGGDSYPKPENDYGSSTPEIFGSSFSDKAIRRAFIRKVYLILMTQLAFTTACIALFVFEPNTKAFVRRNVWMYWLSYAIFFVTYITLACCPSVRRKYPTNVVMLCIFTLAMSYMVAMISSVNDTEIVFYAMAICAVVCLGVTIFAMQTRFDFTMCGGFLFIAVLVLFVFGIFALIFRNNVVHLIYSALMALLFTIFLAYDTQMIIGGRRHEMSAEEYVFGALQLYLDVIYIFLSILSIFGSSK